MHKIASKVLGKNRFQLGEYTCECGEKYHSYKSWYRHSVDARKQERASV